MAKCGCAQGACFCVFSDSENVEFTGTGSVSDPVVATPKPLLTVADTPTLALTLDVADDEMTLSAQPLTAAHVDIFTANGTWNKPVGVTYARVMLVGAGGGGASGGSGRGSLVGAGTGGDAGQVAIFTLVDTEIPATAAVVVGAAGTGGAPDTSGPGLPGTNGTASSFDVYTVPGGAGGQPDGVEPNHLGQGDPPGQYASDGAGPFTPAHYYLAPGAGGCGHAVAGYGPDPGGYSHPGQGSRFPDDTGGGAAGGGDGRDEPVTKMGGGGGGGEFGTFGDATAGGNGGLYGGGGGGGGSEYGRGTYPSGAGGDGAPGIVVVISW